MPMPRSLPVVCIALVCACDGSTGRSPTGRDAAALDPPDDAGPLDVSDFAPLDGSGQNYTCEIGVADPEDETRYLELAPGGEIPIGGSGQAGLTARMAVRVVPLDGAPALDRAYVELRLTNLDSGVIADSKPRREVVELSCGSDGICDRAPVYIEISHVAKLPELEGLAVGIVGDVRSADDAEVTLARARTYGVLQRL